jgi:hypothetical protein
MDRAIVLGIVEQLQRTQDRGELRDVVRAASDVLAELGDLPRTLEINADTRGPRISAARSVGVNDDRVLVRRSSRVFAQRGGAHLLLRTSAHFLVAHQLAFHLDEVVGRSAVRLRRAHFVAELDAAAVHDGLARRKYADVHRLAFEFVLFPGHRKRGKPTDLAHRKPSA